MPEASRDPAVVRRLSGALERIGEVSRVLLRAAAAAEGVSPTQAQLLLRLHHTRAEPDQHGTVALAAWLDVAAPTVSDAVATLERKGLVARRVGDNAADLRRVAIQLTTLGSAAAERLTAWDEPLQAAVHASRDPQADVDPLASALEVTLRTIGNLQRAGKVSVARTCTTCRFFRTEPDADAPYWCNLLEAPLGPASLRLDCPDHQATA
jgi:DNA-binding MarR family transcriptional regulator